MLFNLTKCTIFMDDNKSLCYVQTFAHSSSSDNCLPQYIPIKHCHEKQKLKFCSEIYNNEEYNQLFTMEEVRRSLNRSRDTAAGPDRIHYQFLKHLSESSLRVLLRAVLSSFWQTGLVYWGLTPQQHPGSCQDGEMMMMKSVFWWRKPEYPEETTDLRQLSNPFLLTGSHNNTHSQTRQGSQQSY